MARFFLAPLGRAEPDDVQGWMEQGGFLALQRALTMTGAERRAALNGVMRRDGQGSVALVAGQAARVNLTVGDSPDPVRFLLEELPLWLLEGALLLALACERPQVSLYLHPAERAHREVLAELQARLTDLGFLGSAGWMGGVDVALKFAPAPPEALDALSVYLLPIVLWQGRDPRTTLLAVRGQVAAPAVYEVPLGVTVRTLVYQWAGGVTTPHPAFYQNGARLALDSIVERGQLTVTSL